MMKHSSHPNNILELAVLNNRYWMSLCVQGENNRPEQQQRNKNYDKIRI